MKKLHCWKFICKNIQKFSKLHIFEELEQDVVLHVWFFCWQIEIMHVNHVKKKLSRKQWKRKRNECAQNVLKVLGKTNSQLFGVFVAFAISTLYKLTSFQDSSILFCSRGTNVFVIWLYKLDVTHVSKTFVNQLEKLKWDLTKVLKKV